MQAREPDEGKAMTNRGTDSTTGPGKPPSVAGFAHLLMQVSDIERSRRFYVEVLGFTVRQAKPLADGRPFMPFNEGLALTTGGPGAGAQIDHMAFRVNNVRAIAERCEACGVRFRQRLHDGIYGLTVYLEDPDGTVIELFEEGVRLG
jgi:catechol 2,3-dioxygenase-like lactoylglutathione lyase family enzyme